MGIFDWVRRLIDEPEDFSLEAFDAADSGPRGAGLKTVQKTLAWRARLIPPRTPLVQGGKGEVGL